MSTRAAHPLRLAALALAGIAGIAALSAAGCTPSQKSEQAAALARKIKACDLFPQDEAEKVSHESVARMTSTLEDAGHPDPAACVYNSGTLDQPRLLSLVVRNFNDTESAARVEADSLFYLRRLSGKPVLHIRSLGDGAVWAGGKLQQLHVRRGPVQLLVTVQSPDGSEQLAEARTIASLALARLEPILAGEALTAPRPPKGR